ncbi:MAG: FkbM family methyltransferase [Limisphaerales bacterium]
MKPSSIWEHLPLPKWIRKVVEACWIHYYFKFVLPRLVEVQLQGISINVSSFSTKVRNRLNRNYEEAETEACINLLRKSDLVLEIGSGIGFIGLFCQKRIGVSRYLSVEANPETIERLKENYRLNGIPAEVLHSAIGPCDGTSKLSIDGDFWDNRLITHSEKVIPVPCITFESLLRKIPFKPSAVIIDAEGAEQFIDFRKIPDEIKKIIIEIHPVIVGVSTIQEIKRALFEKGFHLVFQKGDTLALTKDL